MALGPRLAVGRDLVRPSRDEVVGGGLDLRDGPAGVLVNKAVILTLDGLLRQASSEGALLLIEEKWAILDC